jgi:YVTN family beta-propeller protein
MYKRLVLCVALVLIGVLLVSLVSDVSVTSSGDRDIESLSTSIPAKRASSAIAITLDGTVLAVVNPDSNSLTLVDTAGHAVLAEVPVGVDPRTVAVDDAGSRAYVANRGSDSISVVDLTAHQVITEVMVGDRPYGTVLDPAGEWLYVAEQGVDRMVVFDAGSLERVSAVPVADRPSGLAISDDGRTLYVTHLLSNTISVLTVRPFTVYLPSVFREADAFTSAGKAQDIDASLTARAAQLPVSLSSSIRLWPDSNLVQSIVLSPDGQRAYVPHTRSNTASRALIFDATVFPLVSLIDPSTQQHLIGQQIDLGTLDPPGVGLPFDAAVTPSGDELWVVNAASNDVSVIDLVGNSLAAHVEVGDNPRGIVLSPDGSFAYVNNTLAGTVSVIDTAAYTVTAVITVTDIPLPPTLLNGKRLFHSSDDPRMARAQWISCNTCHFEGEHDGRTWFFGFAGPRNTTSLLGMVETYPLRWSGEWDESADAEFANRKENFGSGLIAGDVNCTGFPPDCTPPHPPNQGRSYDLDCLAAFMDSLSAPLSPAHAHGEPLSEAELRGQAIFVDPALGCVSCHPPPLYTDQQMHDVGTATLDEKIGTEYDTPTLRGLHDSAPYFHDGSAATLHGAVTYPSSGSEHDVSGLLTEEQIQDLIAFLMALPFE